MSIDLHLDRGKDLRGRQDPTINVRGQRDYIYQDLTTDVRGRKHRIRALLDTGSASNFISRSVVEKFRLETHAFVSKPRLQSASGSSVDIDEYTLLNYKVKGARRHFYRKDRFLVVNSELSDLNVILGSTSIQEQRLFGRRSNGLQQDEKNAGNCPFSIKQFGQPSQNANATYQTRQARAIQVRTV